MRKFTRIILILAFLFVAPIALAKAQVEIPDPKPGDLTATIVDTDGNPIGGGLITPMEDVEEIADALLVVVFVWEGLEPGFHALHIHSVGTCEHDLDAPFTSAAGHFNPDETDHGTHAGDLPSLYILAMGGGGLMYITDAFTIEDLLDEDGSAIMIHAGHDNYGNIPERYGGPDESTLAAGDAGARVACGVIELNG